MVNLKAKSATITRHNFLLSNVFKMFMHIIDKIKLLHKSPPLTIPQ